MTALDHALELAALGYRVAPIPAGLKYPGRDDWQQVGTTNPDTIRSWWAGQWRPDFNDNPDEYGVCIVTGVGSGPNGIFVVDIDPKDHGDEFWADLEHEHGAAPDTMECLTGGGGRHLYFNMPDGVVIRNDQSGRVAPGVDIRGEGGQVVAPPTVHPKTGNRYEWDALNDPTDGAVPVDAPQWLIDILTAEPEERQPRRGTNATSLSDRPGDRFEAETDWADLLTAEGWTLHSVRNGRDGYYEMWTRPGKDDGGASASLYYKGSDVLKNFSPNSPHLKADATYTRFGFYAATKHGGDHGKAAGALAEKYAPRTQPTRLATAPTPDAEPEEIADWESMEPIPLGESFRRPQFPVRVFPQWVQHQVLQAADELQMTPDLPAQLAVTALSIAVADRAFIKVNGPWRESLNTYCVTALPPGAGKSPVFRVMLSPLEEFEAELAEQAAASFQRVKLERDMVEAELDKVKRKGERARALELQDELAEMPLPVVPRLMVEDITPEKLAEMIGEQGGRLALVSTEGGLFSMMAGRYSDRANLDVYLQAWSQDTIRVDRISGRELVVRKPTLTIGTTVQPSVIAKLADNPELAGRGLTSRFMYSIPTDTVGYRDLGRASTWNDAVASMYGRSLVGLAEQLRADWERAGGSPVALELSSDARAMFLRWRQAHEARLASDGDLRFMAEWVTKLQSTTARLAGLLHLADRNSYQTPVSAATMAAAIEVGDYWEAHARIAHDLWGSDADMHSARKLIDWAIQNGISEFSTADVQRALRRVFERVEDMVDPLNVLMDRGWVRPLFEGDLRVGQRGKSKRFAVNPKAFSARSGDEGHQDGFGPGGALAVGFAEGGDPMSDRTGQDSTSESDESSQGVTEYRAMRAMCLKADQEQSIYLQREGRREHPANGANGANLAEGGTSANPVTQVTPTKLPTEPTRTPPVQSSFDLEADDIGLI